MKMEPRTKCRVRRRVALRRTVLPTQVAVCLERREGLPLQCTHPNRHFFPRGRWKATGSATRTVSKDVCGGSQLATSAVDFDPKP